MKFWPIYIVPAVEAALRIQIFRFEFKYLFHVIPPVTGPSSHLTRHIFAEFPDRSNFMAMTLFDDLLSLILFDGMIS